MINNKQISYALAFAMSAVASGSSIRRVPGYTVQRNMVPRGVSVRMIISSEKPSSFERSCRCLSIAGRNKDDVRGKQHQESQSTGLLSSSNELELSKPSHLYPHLVLLAAKTRSAVEDVVGDFLRVERRRLYAIHRPSPCRNTSTVTSPYEYILVLQKLKSCDMGRDAKKVYLVFAELLKKPLHPSQAGMEWDLSDQGMMKVQAKALAEVMSALEGLDALLFAQSCLLSSTNSTSSDASEPYHLLLYTLQRYLREGGCNRTLERGMEGTEGEKRLIVTDIVVGAVAAALIRCGTTVTKHQAMELLQLASIARLRGIYVFTEDIAVMCAEAAAIIGDTETVTRIIFLLYRFRGVLGQSVEPLKNTGSHITRVGSSLWTRVVGNWGLLRSSEKTTESGENLVFQRAVARLLKSVIHATLHHLSNTNLRISLDAMKEAIRLFDDLRTGCDWDGIASMAVELLSYMKGEARRHYGLEDDIVSVESLFYIQGEVMYILNVVRESLPTRPSLYQQTTYSACVAFAIECYLVDMCNYQGSIGVSVMGLPLLLSQKKHRDYLESSASTALSLLKTTVEESQEQYLYMTLAATAALVAANAVLLNIDSTISDMYSYLRDFFLRRNLQIVKPTDLMSFFSSLGDQGISCGALWLYIVLVAGPDQNLPIESLNINDIIVLGASKQEWILAALPSYRKMLWELFSTPGFQPYVSLVPWLPGIVLCVMEQVMRVSLGCTNKNGEALLMLQFLCSQLRYSFARETTALVLMEKLIGCVLRFTITTVNVEDVVMESLNFLNLDHTCEEVLVVVGASVLRSSCDPHKSLPERMREIATLSRTLTDSFNAVLPTKVNCRLMLTVGAVVTLIKSSLQETSNDSIRGASEVLQWLRGEPPSDLPIQQVLFILPVESTTVLLKDTLTSQHSCVKSQESFDGVSESCAIAYTATEKSMSLAQRSRLTVYFWKDDNNDNDNQYNEHHTYEQERDTVLEHHGVNLLSRRRAQVKRAKADLMDILRTPLYSDTSARRHHKGMSEELVKCRPIKQEGLLPPYTLQKI
ncbi:uncharacterized protein TM35_000371510 [Trypanosoma theileri]|uniref:Uncharacterized protein n=1 Tax=Trypanosoma theileri TaxID=67003 RepID=A0A1X0NKX7_9TRYP|nr:uncharacterized protein TM35_000371510 [Trypanosoma theileri]ORC85178.1 hypothetical protein TM35_000371510 [Trypanosoma theileri]